MSAPNVLRSPIDWKSEETVLLYNPRTPDFDPVATRAELDRLQSLQAHIWMATSGSTAQVAGQLKWVALSRKALLASADAVNRHLGVRQGKEVWLHALPTFHVGGLGVFSRAHLSDASVVDGLAQADVSGGRAPEHKWFDRKWNAQIFHDRAHQVQATLSALVPAQVHDLVSAGLKAPTSMRAIVVGGGALSETLFRSARALGWPVLSSYGATECCSQVATSLPTSNEPEMKILPHFEVGTDAEGRLSIRGPSLLTGYAVLGGGTSRWIDPKQEGWFVSEDFGEVTNGVLKMHGRRADFIKIGGESVDLLKLDLLLSDLKSAACPDLALIAVPDERLGSVIHAVVAAEPGSPEAREAERVLENLGSRTLPFERPRRVHHLAELPRSPLGKLLRGELLTRIMRE